jgi:hypothetical protein
LWGRRFVFVVDGLAMVSRQGGNEQVLLPGNHFAYFPPNGTDG